MKQETCREASFRGYLVNGLPAIVPGDDIAGMILQRVELQDHDVVCIASTIVAKSEGRIRSLESYSPTKRAAEIARRLNKDPRFVQAVLEESVDVLLDSPFLLVVTSFGHICVNAGIDQSNVDAGNVLLLPKNPSRSAERLRESLGGKVAVIITDTCGRPFRSGVTGVAIGCAGIGPLRDWRGERDMNGRVLEITLESVADEFAGIANSMMGEAGDGTPVAVLRGLFYPASGGELFMPQDKDVIRAILKR
jgi:coenzyme F420-0:L-glutamate ligase/coenzyme F420-1:gamma-L-glutamate ligase